VTFVIGPAEDGGYYLLGMKKCLPVSLSNKEWELIVFEKIHC
jgi:glycosyltransferase A (GT-A) superfamily protein (DUF2064 family)